MPLKMHISTRVMRDKLGMRDTTLEEREKEKKLIPSFTF